MTDLELRNIINRLRDFTLSSRQSFTDLPDTSSFFLNVIEIACCLAELGILEKRPIAKENEYWFEGSYLMNFWNSDTENDLYTPLANEVKQRNYFR